MTSFRLPFALVLLAITLATGGCASTGSSGGSYEQQHVTVDGPAGRVDLLLTREQYLSSDTITVPPARAWPALVQTYAGFGVPLQGADGKSRTIATQYFHAHATFAGERMSRWLDCGSTMTGEISTNYEITLRFGTLIDTSAAGRSIVRTAVTATAIAPGSGTTPVDCSTRGALERRIAALVASKS
ncbi:MAG TPA: hypothetical protein VJO33_15500 [Gemmatimonadaceae bacterium]|nr:hypothetical protein [Gemmatimonadaceae bacterium]